MKSVWQLTSRPVTAGPEAPGNGLWLCRGSRGALSAHWLHRGNILMQKSTPCDFLGSDETRPLKSLSSPLTEVKLWAPLSLGTGSGAIRRLEWSALIWLSARLFNWQYLVLCFLDAGFKGASYFSAQSQISLKGFKITEAHSLPVRLRGAKELCTATRHYLKNTRLLTGKGENLGHTVQFPSYQNHALYVKLSNLSAWAICPFK